MESNFWDVAELILTKTSVYDFTEFDNMSSNNYNKIYYYDYSNAQNIPSELNTSAGIIFAFLYASASIYQILITNEGEIFSRRRYEENNWSKWVKLH